MRLIFRIVSGRVRQIADELYKLKGFPPNEINVYLMGDVVVDAPGHSAGHVAFWRESDRTLVLGDVLTNMDTITGVPGLHEPRPFFTPDPARNRESARRLAHLEPALVCFGHGAPLRDTKK